MEAKASLYNKEGELVKEITLEPAIFAAAVNKAIMAQAVRVYLANQRHGTANTKGRGEVSGGGRKPWKQKGSGRARQGSIRAPHWYKGGIAHGPEPRDWSLKLSKQMKKVSLCSALSSKVLENNILVLESLEIAEIKTKPIAALFKKLGIQKKSLLVLPKNDKNTYLSTRNIPILQPIVAKDLNTYEVLKNQKVVFLQDSLEKMKEQLSDMHSKKTEDGEKSVKPTVKKQVKPKKTVKKTKSKPRIKES